MLPGGIDVAHGKVLHDLRHVLVVEERVPAGFVWGNVKRKGERGILGLVRIRRLASHDMQMLCLILR